MKYIAVLGLAAWLGGMSLVSGQEMEPEFCEPGTEGCVCFEEGFCAIMEGEFSEPSEPEKVYKQSYKKKIIKRFPDIPFQHELLAESNSTASPDEGEGESSASRGGYRLRYGNTREEEVIDCAVEVANYYDFLITKLKLPDSGSLSSTVSALNGHSLVLDYRQSWINTPLTNLDIPELSECTSQRVNFSGFRLLDNYELTDLSFMEGVTALPNSFVMQNGFMYEDVEISLSPFDNVELIGPEFWLRDYHSVRSWVGFNNVTTSTDQENTDIRVRGSRLNTIHVLENLEGVVDVIELSLGNTGASQVRGFNKITHANELWLWGPMRNINYDNAFQSLESVGSLKLISSQEQGTLPDFVADLSITNELRISGITGSIPISVDFSSLDHITTLTGELDLSQNNIYMNDLNNLQRVGALKMFMTRGEVNGLQSLVDVGRMFRLESTNLTNIDFLQNVTTLRNDPFTKQAGTQITGFYINFNNNLKDITGLRNIASADNALAIQNNNYTARPAMSSPFCQGVLSGNIQIADYNDITGANVSSFDILTPAQATSYLCQ